MKASVRFTGESTPSHTHTQRERGGGGTERKIKKKEEGKTEVFNFSKKKSFRFTA